MTEETKTEAANAVGATCFVIGAYLVVKSFRDMRKAKKVYEQKREHLELTINMMNRMTNLAQDPEMTEEKFDAKLAEETAFIDLVIKNQK